MKSKSAAKGRGRKGSFDLTGVIFNFLVPAVLCLAMVGGIGYLALAGYRVVKSSDFFTMGSIEVEGISRLSREDVEAIVRRHSPDGGTWNADIDAIRAEMVGRREVKGVSVSRRLPDVLRVSVVEREPVAVVKVGDALMWADDDGVLIGPVLDRDKGWDLVMTGWEDSSKSEAAIERNRKRVSIYRTVQDEWRVFSLIERVKEINVSENGSVTAKLREGSVEVGLGRSDFGNCLKSAIEAVAGGGGQARFASCTGDGRVVTAESEGEMKAKR